MIACKTRQVHEGRNEAEHAEHRRPAEDDRAQTAIEKSSARQNSVRLKTREKPSRTDSITPRSSITAAYMAKTSALRPAARATAAIARMTMRNGM